MPNEHRWDTKDAKAFCKNAIFVGNEWILKRYQCGGHKAGAAEKVAADAKAAAEEAAKKAIKTKSSTSKTSGNWYKVAKGSLVAKGLLPASV